MTVSTLANALCDGQVVIVATDTVYGLAALPGSTGYASIFELKERSADQVLPWLVHDVAALDVLVDGAPAYARRLAQMFWPGALTLVLHASKAACELGDVPISMRALPGSELLPEACRDGRASTIVDCTGPYPKILREGPIPEQVLLDVAVFGATLTSHE